jgi:Putative zinc dependent peptidase (DUF5700)
MLTEEKTMWRIFRLAFVFILLTLPMESHAQEVEVDISACRSMDTVLQAMHAGESQEKVSAILDTVLDTRPYQLMFKHYNRAWRPNHLPRDVFKRMILSLRFTQEYHPGENQRADQMRSQWMRYYSSPALYQSQLRQLEGADLRKLIGEGVRYAQTWLPPGWKVPDFYFAVIPNGGSSAFSIDGAQGYDFFQLAQLGTSEIDINALVGTVAHESHHTGMRLDKALPSTDAAREPNALMAYRVVSMCIPEGVANYFISNSPPGRAPAFPDARFHAFNPDLTKAWNERVAEEEDMVQHQAALLDRALAGKLSEDDFNSELRDYWLSGSIGRAYVLGSEMFAAIYATFGKEGVFAAMKDPRQLFHLYNQAIEKKSDVLKRCVRMPEKAVKQSLAIVFPQ